MRPATLLLAVLLAGPAPALADTASFRVTLGGRDLGTVAVETSGEGAAGQTTLRAAFADTPLGLADGTFDATSRPARDATGQVVRQYLGVSAFSREGRTVSILVAGDRVTEVVIDPASDRTEMSAPDRVPAGVADPATAFARLALAAACPAPFRLYDGRRVVIVALAATDAGGTACEGSYRVAEGPGHLSPLGITAIDLAARYDPAGGGLVELDLRSGPFELRLTR